MNVDLMRRYIMYDRQIVSLENKVKLLKELKKNTAQQVYNDLTGDSIAKAHVEPTFISKETGKEVVLYKDGCPRIVKPDITYHPAVPKDNTEQFYDYLRETGNEDLIKPSVHYQTLKSWVTDLKKENKALPPVNLCRIFTIEGVSLRKGKA